MLRRILRRVIRNMRLLGAHDPVMGELDRRRGRSRWGRSTPSWSPTPVGCASIAMAEEEAFAQTLRTGTTIFDTAVADLQRSGGSTLGGDKAFALHDTFGFPIDLTLEMAAEKGIAVDEDGFRRLMAEQRDRAKADSRARKAGLADTTVYRDVMDAAGVTSVHRLRRGRHRGHAARAPRRRRRRPAAHGRDSRSRSSSTAPRSTPRAAGSSPTPA